MNHEAHISAKDPPPCSGARISRAHEHHRWASGARGTSPSWSQASHRRLSRSEQVVVAARLRRSLDVTRVRSDGVGRGDRLFSLRTLSSDLGMIRLAVSAGRGTGGAVERNRARRRLREAVRVDLRHRSTMVAQDLVLVARQAILSATAPEIRASVSRSLDQVARDLSRDKR